MIKYIVFLVFTLFTFSVWANPFDPETSIELSLSKEYNDEKAKVSMLRDN